MRRVVVLGGGPSGAFAAERLASAGLQTVLLDEKLAWEKPCGGGLTWKAWSRYSFLIDNDTPRKAIRRTYLQCGSSQQASLDLCEPLLIYSRFDLNSMLLRRAEKAGAAIEKARVTGLERAGNGWRVQTKTGAIEADYCIAATGARNGLRTVGTEWRQGDTLSALGYFIPFEQDHVDLKFFPGFEGYIWLFPRNGHLSAGIAGKGRAASEMREMLDGYLSEKGISTRGATFYGHVIPSLEKPAWRPNRVAGEGWLAVGDAAGLVDPVTGEGLYYALRSGELAAEAVVRETRDPAGAYRDVLWSEFMEDLEAGSRLAKRLFTGKFLFAGVATRMIQLVRRSPTILNVVQDLFAGTQGYQDLKPRLLSSRGRLMRELAFGRGRHA